MKEFDQDRDEVLTRFFSAKPTLRSSAKRSEERGVGRAIINIGTDLEGNEWGVDWVKERENVFTTVSIHPEDAEKISVSEAVEQVSKLSGEKKVVAIGEIGLDHFWIPSSLKLRRAGKTREEVMKKQRRLFEAQLELATELKKPVVIHCRDAYEDVYSILKTKLEKRNSKVVIHCYQGDVHWTKKFLELGCWFSFTGNITFEKNEEAEIFQVIKMIPLEKLMAETDAPFLAPVPHRGKRNEPVFVKEVIEKIAQVKGLSFEEAEKQTDENAIEFFNIETQK